MEQEEEQSGISGKSYHSNGKSDGIFITLLTLIWPRSRPSLETPSDGLYSWERGALQLNSLSQMLNRANSTDYLSNNRMRMPKMLQQLITAPNSERKETFGLSAVIHCYHTRTALRCIKTWKGWINSGLLMSFEFCKDQNAGRTELKAINLHHSTCLLH